jgi:formylmethanofuran dehydrogenase subunit D
VLFVPILVCRFFLGPPLEIKLLASLVLQTTHNSQDMADIKVKAGDLVEIYNDNGSTQAMVDPTATARRKETFMQFANPNGVQGNVVSPGVNELIIPNYKQT